MGAVGFTLPPITPSTADSFARIAGALEVVGEVERPVRKKLASMRVLPRPLLLFCALLLMSGLAFAQTQELEELPLEPAVMRGYIYQNALTQESYLITSVEELKDFVQYLPPVTPYKILPAPANPDPLLHGFTIDFEQNVLAVAVARNRIEAFPEYHGVAESSAGERTVHFIIPAPTAKAYPYGWAIYSAVLLPRTEGATRLVVESLKAPSDW